MLDKRLLSRPEHPNTIYSHGQISGRNMARTGSRLRRIGILQAGSCRSTLDKEPISEQIISPTLGADTVVEGERAILCSLVAVVVFMHYVLPILRASSLASPWPSICCWCWR